MNLFELAVKIGVDDSEFNKGIGKAKKGFGDFSAWTAAKGQLIADGIKAGGKALIDFGKQAINSYAEYEQLVGGVETLFKDSADKVQEYAANAYKTAGMSANEYMSTVTSFSASLLQSLGGDTDKAAEYANQALTDMSDNANKMGTSMEMIQNAYQGFAKANYTMLDNLKLGYGGTQEEMKRLIADAAELSDTVDAQDMSFANIVKAINVVQTEMGITGTTAKEAGATIAGSVGAMKAAWTNLVTGLADKNADIGKLVDNLVTTIVGDGTENNLGVLGNVMPAVKTALNGASKLVQSIVPVIVGQIPTIIEENVPALLNAAVSLIEGLANGILGVLDNDAFLDSIINIVLKLVDVLTNPETIYKLVSAALKIILAIGKGLIAAIPELLKSIPQIIDAIVRAFGDFLKPVMDIGKNIIDGIKKGISNAWNNLVSWFKGLFGDLIGIAKKILGIASPSKVFKKIGGFTAEGFGAGFEDEFSRVKDDMEDALNFDDASVGINASIRKVGAGAAGGAFGGTSIGSVNITVNGGNYPDEQSLAAAIATEIQNMTDRRAAVYA